MLINRKTVVAVRCPWCGNMQTNTADPFQISTGEGITVKCQCGEEVFTLKKKKTNGYQLNISCIACDHEHIYKLGYKDLWKTNLCILDCHYTHMEVCFLGRESYVKQAVEAYEREMEEIIRQLGIEEFLGDDDLWSESFTRFMDTVEKVNFNSDLGKNIVDFIPKRPKHSK